MLAKGSILDKSTAADQHAAEEGYRRIYYDVFECRPRWSAGDLDGGDRFAIKRLRSEVEDCLFKLSENPQVIAAGPAGW